MNKKRSSTIETSESSESYSFSAEVERLLDLVVHALYSEREIFLRELIANAADALDRRRFESLTNPQLKPPDQPGITVVIDTSQHILTISDDGIGMSHDELVQNLGTIARSGTKIFSEQHTSVDNSSKPSLIGQFGVGFYASFMVADRVVVISRRGDSTQAWQWSSEGKGAYTLQTVERDKAGTDVILYLKSDAYEYLDAHKLQAIIRKWADNIVWRITINDKDKNIEANQGIALWQKPKSEITQDQLNEFYRHTNNLFDTPWATIHWKAEGRVEFTALLFIPSTRPIFHPTQEQRESPVRLHVRRMFITDKAELLPSWLRFVRGIVDTEDLPLNVSREMLQVTPVLARIRKIVTNRVISELRSRSKKDDFKTFWDSFGAIMKEGMWDDTTYRKDIAELALFYSSSGTEMTTLTDYVSRIKEEQKAIYYFVGESLEALRSSPHLEGFLSRGYEILLFTDPVDAFWPERLSSFRDLPLRSITRAREDIENDRNISKKPEKIQKLAETLKKYLVNKVTDVHITDQLVGSAVLLTSPPEGPDLAMQMLLRKTGQNEAPQLPVILEINPSHPVILALAEKYGDPEKEEESFRKAAELLLAIAHIQEGNLPQNPSTLAIQLTELLSHSFKL